MELLASRVAEILQSVSCEHPVMFGRKVISPSQARSYLKQIEGKVGFLKQKKAEKCPALWPLFFIGKLS